MEEHHRGGEDQYSAITDQIGQAGEPWRFSIILRTLSLVRRPCCYVIDVFIPYHPGGNHCTRCEQCRSIKDPLLAKGGANAAGEYREHHVACVVETFISAGTPR
jgi:hypothetical protein